MEREVHSESRPAMHPAAPVTFLAELALVGLAAVTGWRLGEPPWTALLLAVALPLVVVLVWARWFAPTSAHRVQGRWTRYAGQVAVFVGVAVLAAVAGLVWWGVVIAAVAIVAFALAG